MQLVYPRVSVAGRPPVEFCVDLDIPDEVAPWLLEHDWIDEPVHHAFLEQVRPGARVVDLGSHLGLFSLTAAALGAEVLAIDAAPTHVELVRAAAERNGFEHVHVVHGALTAADVPVGFIPNSIHGHLRTDDPGEAEIDWIDVPPVTVDDLLDELGWDRVDVLKMDIEGGEPAALDGMVRLFDRGSRPAIVFECNGVMLPLYGGSARGLRGRIAELGYGLWQIDHLNPGMLIAASPDTIQTEAACDYLALPTGREPGERWDAREAFSLQDVLARLLDQAAIDAPGARRYAAELIAHGPAWLREHDLTRPAVYALRNDADEAVRAVFGEAPPPWVADLAAAPAPDDGGPPDDARVFAEDVAVNQPSTVPDLPPGQAEPPALRGLTFHVRRGELLAITGESAALAIGALADLEPLAEGALATDGRAVALVRIEDGFEPGLSVAENIVVFGAFVGGDVPHLRESAELIATDARLGAALNEPLASADEGAAARIAVTLALEHVDADLLLVAGLPQFRSDDFRHWARERTEHFLRAGGAIVQACETREELLADPQRALRLHDGRVFAAGHPQSVWAL